MKGFKRRKGAPQRAWRGLAALLTFLLLGGCSRLLSLVDPSAF